MTSIIAIDPGMSSGLIWGRYDASTPFVRHGYRQVEGGLAGVQEATDRGEMLLGFDIIVVEKFLPRPVAYSYSLDELEPIRIEGWIEPFWGVVYQEPGKRALLRAGVLASEQLLRDKGLWLMPSDVGMKDADDVNSAQLHLYAYLRSIGHRPTLDVLLA